LILTRHLFLSACNAPRNRTGLLPVVPRGAGLDCSLYDDDSGSFLHAVSCERLDAACMQQTFSGCFGFAPLNAIVQSRDVALRSARQIVRGMANTEAAAEQIPNGRKTRHKKKQSATGDQQSAKQRRRHRQECRCHTRPRMSFLPLALAVIVIRQADDIFVAKAVLIIKLHHQKP
jgi:hypothetical protein